MLARLSFYAALLLMFVPAVAAVDSDSSPSLYCQDMLSKASLARFKSALKRHAANEEQQCDWAFTLDTLINLPRVTTDVLSYEGGFRISLGQFGDSQYASFNYSYGVFTYDPKRNSVYFIAKCIRLRKFCKIIFCRFMTVKSTDTIRCSRGSVNIQFYKSVIIFSLKNSILKQSIPAFWIEFWIVFFEFFVFF